MSHVIEEPPSVREQQQTHVSHQQDLSGARSSTSLRRFGLLVGPALALVLYFLIPAHALPGPERATAAVGTWMAVWWLTEALPIAATSLLPLAAFPITGARTINDAATPYGSPLLFLFLGGFLLALAMERWGLHRRIALATLTLAGTKPRHIVLAFMALTAFLSMWTSNTATTVMMLPIALSTIDLVARAHGERAPSEGGGLPDRGHAFAMCLLLGSLRRVDRRHRDDRRHGAAARPPASCRGGREFAEGGD